MKSPFPPATNDRDGPSSRPSFIPLPPPFLAGSVASGSPMSCVSPATDRTPDSPYAQYFTAPSSPYVSPYLERDSFVSSQSKSPLAPGSAAATASFPARLSPPPTSPSLFVPPSSSPDSLLLEGDYFPQEDDLGLEDESLSAVEKIYLFSRSPRLFHRVFMIHAMPAFLDQISAQEAVEYALPLLSGLAMDKDEVREALAQELAGIMWWFFIHCQVLSGPEDVPPESTSSQAFIYANSFTAILGTLLLSESSSIGGAARVAVVTILARVFSLDGINPSGQGNGPPFDIDPADAAHFPCSERDLVRDELVQQVVIGMGRLDQQIDENEGSLGLLTPNEHTRHGSFPRRTPLSSPSARSIPLLEDERAPSSPSPSSPPYSSNRLDIESIDISSSSPTGLTNGIHSPVNPRPVTRGDALLTTEWASDHSDVGIVVEGESLSYSDSHGAEEEQRASIGRLSSMSLMAAVAASGFLGDQTKHAFVDEVVRVAQDPVYWVRKEASFALGALVKIVPEEMVKTQLMPTFAALIKDSDDHVRHSTLFALPGLLSRLSSEERLSLVLGTVIPMVMDSSPLVRSGLLESLGEIIYVFLGDPGGPPPGLLELFLGNKEDIVLATSEQISLQNLRESLGAIFNSEGRASVTQEDPKTLFFKDPRRAFICAFNFPAVASVLGRERWFQIRDIYLHIATSPDEGVQRTLSASLGEVAAIVGSEYSQTDLLPLWRKMARSSDAFVRNKALGSVHKLLGQVPPSVRGSILREVLECWELFNDWRVREDFALFLGQLAAAVQSSEYQEVVALTIHALKDKVYAVRQGAVNSLPSLRTEMGSAFTSIEEHIFLMSLSPMSKHRITFISCQDGLMSGPNFAMLFQSSEYWAGFSTITPDPVVDVRIALARFVGRIFNHPLEERLHAPPALREIVNTLRHDTSAIVKSFVSPVDQRGMTAEGA